MFVCEVNIEVDLDSIFEENLVVPWIFNLQK